MCREEIFIWDEHWQFEDFTMITACAEEHDGERQESHNIKRRAEHIPSILHHQRIDWQKGGESASLELQNVGRIVGSTLTEYSYRWENAFLYDYALAVAYLLYRQVSYLLRPASLHEKTVECLDHQSKNWYFLHLASGRKRAPEMV